MAQYLLGQSLAHIKLFIAATICVKQAQNRDISWRVRYRAKFKVQPTVSRGKWLYYTVSEGLSQNKLSLGKNCYLIEEREDFREEFTP